jgi:DNA-binding NarL/FixJ family response regulator
VSGVRASVQGQGLIRVAIIEDDPHMRQRLEAVVASAEDMALAATAANFAEGEALVETGGYEVLLCDLGLPDGSGVDLIRREAGKGRDTDILVITLFADQAKVLETIRAGARGYLLKDERTEDCVTAIRDIRRGGSPISPIIARQLLAQVRPEAAPAPAPVSPLSEREREVLNLLSRGLSYAETADILGVTANTIATHVKSIYRKLEVNSRAEAVFEASAQGFLDRR